MAAQSDQHLLVKKQQTDPASSDYCDNLDENQIISELARMSGGVEINETTLQHAKQLRQLKFQASST
ncbi:hypothetical protein ABVN80_03305 [Acinetobacter baumannii]